MRRLTLRCALVLLGALGVQLAFASHAGAAEPAPCGPLGQLQCTTVSVPLDRSGSLPGTVDLHVRVARAQGQRRGVVIVLSGGPGQGTSRLAGLLGLRVASLAPTHDFAFVDQRGTGLSGPLRCPELNQSPNVFDVAVEAARFARCAERIGERRVHYTTVQSAHDLEAVRRALGARTVSLFGISYGTLVAQTYARLYPTRVSSLLLDSVVRVEDAGLLDTRAHEALPRVLRDLCARRACTGFTDNVYRDYLTLARKLADEPLGGPVVARDGRVVQMTIGGPADPLVLYSMVLASDFSPLARAVLPSAMASALAGDSAPLLRLALQLRGPREPENPRSFSVATFAATVCNEAPFPWSAGSSLAERGALLETALAGNLASFAPYRADELARLPLALCGAWPEANVEPLPAGPLPNVPTLLMGGAWDARTPLEAASALARELPQSTILGFGQAGHGSGLLSGGASEMACFLLGAESNACFDAQLDDLFSMPFSFARPAVRPLAPRSLGDVRRAGGVSGIRGRVLAAVRRTVDDARYMAGLLPGNPTPRIGGLRSGAMRLRTANGHIELVLKRYAYVPGVRVSGVVRIVFGTARARKLRIEGSPQWRGVLTLRPSGELRGRLAGKDVEWRGRPVS